MGVLQLDEMGVRVACPGCGARNRLAYERLGDDARCARCQTAIGSPDEPIAVPSLAVFDALVGAAALPVLVDFWAAWCPPCRMVAPELEKVARARAGRALVVKVDTEALAPLSARFDVRSIPTLAVFVAGREVKRTAGAMPAAAIEQLIDAAA
jgi:thioredoxin 2